ncbi:MAG: hypothetical protein JNL13_10380 [Chitinophagaceae bacterium]|nr:hypothetical protein [Chitinophagaceae bacterium]
MMLNQVTLIGIVASICTGVSLLPQLFKIYRDKECQVSVLMLAVLFLGNAFWVWYGILKQDAIIIASNSFSILVNLCVTALWLKYRGQTVPTKKEERTSHEEGNR